MCGRFVSASPPDEIAKYFGVESVSEKAIDPSFNVAPTNEVLAVLESGGKRRLDVVHWGLIPFWAKDMKIGSKMFNARAETLAEKNAFKNAFKKRRCLIPADGFYEWKKIRGQSRKQPMYIHRADGEPFAFAGLWETWRPDKDVPVDENTQWVRSCTIITGEPNDKVAEIHDRMPVMLPPSAWAAWLDPDNDDTDELQKLFVPAPSELIEFHPVTTAVNNVRMKGPDLAEPAEPVESQAASAGPEEPEGQGTLL